MSELEKEHGALLGRMAAKAADLELTRADLARLPAMLLNADGDRRAGLIDDYAHVKARAEIETAELAELHRQAALAWLTICQAREQAAASASQEYYQGVYLAAVQERDDALNARLRYWNADRRSAGPAERDAAALEGVRLNVAAEDAKARLALVVVAKMRQLRDAHKMALAEVEEAERAAMAAGVQ